MAMNLKQIKVETTPDGVQVTIPRTVGKDVVIPLPGDAGPNLVTALLQALEPHFPMSKDPNAPHSVIMTAKGFAWQVGVSGDRSATVNMTIRPPTIPGIHYVMASDIARAIGKGLLDNAAAADATEGSSTN
jgi:hypothetical protein